MRNSAYISGSSISLWLPIGSTSTGRHPERDLNALNGRDSMHASPIPAAVPPAHRERRHCRRLSCKGFAHVRVVNVEAHATGAVTNLSTAGCFIEFAESFNISYGQRLDIWLEINQLPLRVMGCTRFVEAKVGVGVEFTDVTSRGHLQLQNILSELAAPLLVKIDPTTS